MKMPMKMKTWMVFAATAISLAVLSSACSSKHRPAGVGAKDIVQFDGLPQMVATSDLVIEGTVKSVEPGRIVGEGESAIQFNQVGVVVDRVLYGQVDSDTVTLEEYGLEGNHPSQVGDHGVYFLHVKTDAPRFFRLVNSQGRFLDDGKGGLSAIDGEAGWVKDIESESLAQLELDIDAAAKVVAEGGVQPASPSK